MAESISIPSHLSKIEKYERLIPQIKAIIENESNLIANMANMAAALKEVFSFWWVGFYLVDDAMVTPELVLGPFQGPVACTRIAFGKGVCGSAWKEKVAIIVPDVEKFPGHIACSSASKSEIVVPLFKTDSQDTLKVFAVLDVDSEYQNHFDEIDQKYLEQIVNLLS